MKKGKLFVLIIVTLTTLLLYSLTVLAIEPLPSGPTYKEVIVATVQDEGEEIPLRTNIYLPEESSAEPTPLVIYIHGHGGAYNFSNGSRSYELSIALKDRGIAVATADYRYGANMLQNVYEVKAYIRYFRAHAKEYNIDPNRIAVWGTSRGGHLAAMILSSGDVKELEGDVGENLDQSSKVQCGVIYYPLTDVIKYYFEEGKIPPFFFDLDDPDAEDIDVKDLV